MLISSWCVFRKTGMMFLPSGKLDWPLYHGTPLYKICIPPSYILQGSCMLCNCLSLRILVSCINHLPPVCLSTFWKFSFKHQLVCKFGIAVSVLFSCLVYTKTFTYIEIFVIYQYLVFYLPYLYVSPSALFLPSSLALYFPWTYYWLFLFAITVMITKLICCCFVALPRGNI